MVVMAAPKGTLPAETEERMAKTTQAYTSEGTEIVVGYPAQGSGFVPRAGDVGAISMTRNHILIAERMIHAEGEGMDACIPYGMMEFGAELARGRCKIPIVGQARAAYTMAALMSDRMGVITYKSATHNGTWRQIREQGFLERTAGLGAVEMDTKDMWGRSPLLLQRFGEESKRLVQQGAEVIVCHGMSMSPLEYTAAELTEAAGVPVIEGMGSAIALCQAWHRLGTPYSPVRYSSK